MTRSGSRVRRLLLTLGILGLATTVACGGAAEAPTSENSANPDDGSQLTMWVRSDGSSTKALVEAYNKTHQNQVKLTIIPGETYQQKVGAAAGSKSLPDILAADVVYSPNYVEQGLLLDVTDKVAALPFKADLAPAHVTAVSKDDRAYGVPHIVDLSLVLYNKDLYAKAGLDPEQPPKTFEEMYTHGKAIRELGGDTYGFYLAGNCAGCNSYTLMPYLAAAKQPPLSDDGKTAALDTPAMREVTALYKRMLDEDIAPKGAATETGATWDAGFQAGKVGILPGGSFSFLNLKKAKFDWGVASLMAPDGSASSGFVGGDVVSVTSTSKYPEQAWNFIEWTLSEEAQVEVLAKRGVFTSRVDLADNQYFADDPRLVASVKSLADGYTPKALAYGEIFNAANGPWLAGLRAIIVNGADPNAELAKMQTDAQKILDESS